MIESLKRSWNLTKESWQVLVKDKELMIFPILSAIVTLIVIASFVAPVSLFWGALEKNFSFDETTRNVVGAIILFCFYFITYFVIIFFNVAILECVSMRFGGGDPKFKDGLDAGFRNLGRIAQWAFLSGVIGVILNQIERKLGFIGGIIRRLLGGAWTIVTFFAVPVMIYEKTSPWQAMKRSGSIIKKTWGESLTAYIGLGAVQGLLVFLSIIPLMGGVALAVATKNFVILAVIGGLVVLFWIAMAIVFSTLKQIFRAALYVYATTGEVPSVFSQDNIKGAFRQK